MPSRSTGSVVRNKDGTFTAKVTLQRGRPSLPLPHCRTESEARERARVLAELARRMGGTDPAAALRGLQRVADARPGQTLACACEMVNDLIAGWRPTAANMPTLKQLGDWWCDEELAEHYPAAADIEKRAYNSVSKGRSTLERYIYPLLGGLPVDEVTKARCDLVKQALPKRLRNNSKRQALQPLKTLLEIAALVGLIDCSPLPAKWLPKRQPTRTLQWMYPDEDAALMACTEVPLWFRVLVGYLNREGGRIQETLNATLSHFDLQRGVARLDARMTKTATARQWMLEPGTKRALVRWRELVGTEPGAPVHTLGHVPMFVDWNGEAVSKKGLPKLLRGWLRHALEWARGTEHEVVIRTELFTKSSDSRWLVIHDCRATYATVKLALGMPTKHVRQRTGHMADTQLAVYDRLVQTFKELRMADFVPLDLAIPELCLRSVRENAPTLENKQLAYSIVDWPAQAQASETAENRGKPAVAGPHMPSLGLDADTSRTLQIEDLEAQVALLQAQLANRPTPAELARALRDALRGGTLDALLAEYPDA